MMKHTKFYLSLALSGILLVPCNGGVTAATSVKPTPSAKKVVKGPTDGILLLGSGKNNFVTGSNGVVYLKGGTLFVMTKSPAKDLVVATTFGIVKIPRDSTVLIAYQNERLVVDNLSSDKEAVRIALSKSKFPKITSRIVELKEKTQFVAIGDLPATTGGKPVVVKNLPSIIRESGLAGGTGNQRTIGIVPLTTAALGAAGAIINTIASTSTLLPWQYMYLNSLHTESYLDSYLNYSSWYSPDGYDFSVTSLELVQDETATQPLGTPDPTAVRNAPDLDALEDANDQRMADDVSNDTELNDTDTDKDGIPDSQDDDGSFDDEAGATEAGATEAGAIEAGASEAGASEGDTAGGDEGAPEAGGDD